MTASQRAFIKQEAARRGMDANSLIRFAVGFLERAAANRERMEEFDRRHGLTLQGTQLRS